MYNILAVQYPGCTNYEGKKVLVFEGDMVKFLIKLAKLKCLDPHFCEENNLIARFVPTIKGIELACVMAKNVIE